MDQIKFKYPRTWHLPWSEGATDDDKILTQKELEEYFYPMEDVYVSLKMDGENTTIGKGYSHARSLDSKHHWSRDHIKALTAQLYPDIPDGWRICGENMYATHSIRYDNLESFFYVISIWDENNMKLELTEALQYCELLGLIHVPIIKRGKFRAIPFSWEALNLTPGRDEGYVVCNAKPFHHSEARNNIAKCVRKNHVTTGNHWMYDPNITTNTLKGQEK